MGSSGFGSGFSNDIGGDGFNSAYLDGKIGACYFYTKGLTAADVSTNYSATKSRYGL